MRPGEAVWNPKKDLNSPAQAGTGRNASSSQRTARANAGKRGRTSTAGSENEENETAEERRQRFLERNRMAASKCRQKKKQWVQSLEERAEQVTSVNDRLRSHVAQLKEEVLELKTQLLAHRNCDCNVIQQYVNSSHKFGGSGTFYGGVSGGGMMPSAVMPSSASSSSTAPMAPLSFSPSGSICDNMSETSPSVTPSEYAMPTTPNVGEYSTGRAPIRSGRRTVV